MVKRERETFLHISQIRGTIKKFAVVLAFVCAFVFMLLSKSENVLIEKTSGTAGEIVSSAVDVLVMPAAVFQLSHPKSPTWRDRPVKQLSISQT